jgi:hypothetical protein
MVLGLCWTAIQTQLDAKQYGMENVSMNPENVSRTALIDSRVGVVAQSE